MFAKLAGERDDFAKVFVVDGSDAGGLKDAVMAKLKLDAAPNRVRLLLEVEGHAPIPLDSRKALAGQGVLEGASVVVEVIASEVLASAYRPRVSSTHYISSRIFAPFPPLTSLNPTTSANRSH